MKRVIPLIILLVASVGFAYRAYAVTPENSLWFDPVAAQADEAITLNAFVYNPKTVQAIVLVEFKTDQGVVIGTKQVTVAPGGGATALQQWKMPAQKTSVTAMVVSATDIKKVQLTPFDTTIGTIVLDVSTPAPVALPFEESARSWWKTTVAHVEDWRLTHATSCEEKKALYRNNLGLDGKVPVGKDLLPLTSNEKTSSDTVSHLTNANDYFGLVWNSACAVFLGNELLFYIATGLFLFLLFRMIIGRIL